MEVPWGLFPGFGERAAPRGRPTPACMGGRQSGPQVDWTDQQTASAKAWPPTPESPPPRGVQGQPGPRSGVNAQPEASRGSRPVADGQSNFGRSLQSAKATPKGRALPSGSHSRPRGLCPFCDPLKSQGSAAQTSAQAGHPQGPSTAAWGRVLPHWTHPSHVCTEVGPGTF